MEFVRNLSIGARGNDVKPLSLALKKLGYVLSGSADYFDRVTRKAVMDLQKKYRLSITGVVDRKTVEAINKALEGAVRGGAVKPPAPSVMLRPEFLYADLKNINRIKDKKSREYISSKFNAHISGEVSRIAAPESEAMKKALESAAAGVDFYALKGSELKGIIVKKILPKIRKKAALKEEADRIEARLASETTAGVDEILKLDLPANENPLFRDEIRVAKVREYARLAKLSSVATEKLATKGIDLDEAGDAELSGLVKTGVIKNAGKKALELITALGRLGGNNIPLITAIQSRKVRSASELVAWEKTDWVRLIKEKKVPLPPGETAETYSNNIIYNIESANPTRFMLERLTSAKFTSRAVHINSLNKLLKNNDRLIVPGSPTKINWAGVGSAARNKMKNELDDLTALANTFRHLGIVEVINDKTIAVSKKESVIRGRIKLVERFYRNNEAMDVRETNFFGGTGNAVNWTGIPVTDRPAVTKQLMAFQRMMNLADNYETRAYLLGKGFDSSMAITDLTESAFLKNFKSDKAEGKMVFRKAVERAVSVAHNFGTIRDAVRGHFGDIKMSNISPTLINDLRDIDGFDDLFGNQNYCDCGECNSILSPAAYFVDLMYYIEQHISKPVFSVRPNHNLYLRRRRPDLWKLRLTCENTNRLIPYLTIVNEVLESYLAGVTAKPIYEHLRKKSTNISFSLPFNLPLEEIRIYLGHFETSLYEIYKSLNQPGEKTLRAKLNLSKEEFAIIAVADPANVKHRFGNPSTFNNFDLQDFIRRAGISRGELDDLLRMKYNPGLRHIRISKKTISGELQNFPEIMNGLTPARLDLIHRFIRLWKKTHWTITELDRVLTSLKDAALATTALKDTDVLRLSGVVIIQEELKVSVEELCALISQLPVSDGFPASPAKTSDRRLFELLFNPKELFGVNASTSVVNSSTVFHHYAFNTSDPADTSLDPKTPLLLGGLGISETELILYLDLLKDEMPFDSHGNTTLDREKISLLYRHARIAKSFRLKAEEFIQALRLSFPASDLTLKNLTRVHQFIEFCQWLKTSPFTIPGLMFVLKGEETGAVGYKIDEEKVVVVAQEIQKIVVQKIRKISASDELTAPEVKALKVKALKERLSRFLNISSDRLDNCLFWTGDEIIDASIITAVDTTITGGVPDNPAELDPLINLVKRLERVLSLFDTLELDKANLEYLSREPGVPGISDPTALSLDDIKALVSYAGLMPESEEDETALRAVLSGYLPHSIFSDANLSALAGIWREEKNLIESIAGSLTLSAVPVQAVEYIFKVLGICGKLGLNGFSLQKLVEGSDDSAHFDRLLVARDIALGAFSSKYDDVEVRAEKIEPYVDGINVKKRDALCDFIISREKTLKFKDLHDVYAFFLLDVEMSGCFRTSRLVCAISSLQLYVDRVLTNLEASRSTPSFNVADLIGREHWEPLRDEWEWRKNYRVWEANRKVFLYPENYIEPDLRDNKTPAFKELEDELLQEKITKKSAETAYVKYLSQLTVLAKLRIAGSYYHEDRELPEESVYYIFGRTNTDPYQYYYLTYNPARKGWGNWEKIELAIEAKEVSAIIHRGRLFLFWTDAEHKEVTNISGGSATSGGHRYKVYTKYSFLDENGKWSPPQKLYTGHWFFDDPKVYRRAWGHPGNITDNNSEVTFKRFKEQVFRRPYPVRRNSEVYPFYAYYIWSQNKGEDRRTYTVAPVDADMTWSLFHVHISATINTSGSRSFTLKSDEFPRSGPLNATISNIEVSALGQTLSIPGAVSVNGTVTLASSASCYFTGSASISVSFLGNTITLSIPLLMPLPVTSSPAADRIYATRHSVSLAANKIFKSASETRDGFYKTPITYSSRSFLRNEYDLAFLEGGPESSYIQNGAASFAYISRVTEQENSNEKRMVLSTSGVNERVSLSAVLVNELSERIFAKGLEVFLSLGTQYRKDYLDRGLDFTGAYGVHYRELFFHIPFLIASHLNANQKFKEARWWYERIFDPTAGESPRDAVPADRNWRYLEFRGLTIDKMKQILVQDEAIEKYKSDPFNPHAIARLRLNAYQKTIVMKYIDNLLDWGDHLFAQDTRESINEATMLYVLASDILGKRPVRLGKCETIREEDLTYEKIGPSIGNYSEFLIYLENWVMIKPHALRSSGRKLSDALKGLSLNAAANTSLAVHIKSRWKDRFKTYGVTGKKIKKNIFAKKRIRIAGPAKRPPVLSFAKQSTLVFCVPPNDDLLKYWKRVEDRLSKIRHCMNISGVRRSLALFQPPIDPMMLVRAKAAGLSLEDIMGVAGKIPPYRFSYLIEKARQFTQTVQGFGSALLSALEKKDVEELTLLRSVHERNILRMTKNIKKKQLQEAQHQYAAIEETQRNVQNRIDYYQGLVDSGLTGWEVTQQVSKHTASILQVGDGLLRLMAGIGYLVPEVGSPFAMKYGGKQIADSADAFAEVVASAVKIAEAVSASAGLEANFQRREQEWKQQLKLAQQEHKQVEKQKLAAEIRSQIAEKDLEIHEKNMEQADEMNDFYKNKFTNLGLYNYLSTTLNRLFREAYNVAYDMAKMAEQAYQFEQDDNTIFVANDNWQFDRAGLLAGERLTLQLQKMEKAYIENNVRTPEITQSFSLAILDASELVKLRQTGSCAIKIPELAFEILYPGQYKRLIKSARITIPCVVGPYTNVSAKLTLLKGEVESNDGDPLTEVLIGKNTSITTSSANSDAGMFEFNFRDERYLPFEGGGAVSEWRLELPSKVRSFNYDTISDVILHISYTAKDGDRAAAENNLAAAITAAYAAPNGLFRLLSLKHEFPDALHQLLDPAPGADQTTQFSVEQSHFPYLLTGKTLNFVQTRVYLKPKKGMSVGTPASMKINTKDVAWSTGDDIAMPGSSGAKDRMKGGAASLGGSPVKTWDINAGKNGLDKGGLDDILILVKYAVS